MCSWAGWPGSSLRALGSWGGSGAEVQGQHVPAGASAAPSALGNCGSKSVAGSELSAQPGKGRSSKEAPWLQSTGSAGSRTDRRGPGCPGHCQEYGPLNRYAYICIHLILSEKSPYPLARLGLLEGGTGGAHLGPQCQGGLAAASHSSLQTQCKIGGKRGWGSRRARGPTRPGNPAASATNTQPGQPGSGIPRPQEP